jgi:hypothetical protein
MSNKEKIKNTVEYVCNTVSKDRLHKSLEQLKAFVKEKERLESWVPFVGLCGNSNLPGSAMLFLSPYWEGFTGDGNYPISGVFDYYNSPVNKYSGEQLELRLSLAKFIVKCFEEYGNVK